MPLALAGVLVRPRAAAAGITREGLTGREIVVSAGPWDRRVHASPEYTRTLERILISVPFESVVEDAAGVHHTDRASLPFLREVFAALFTALPGYATLDLVVPARGQDRLVPLLERVAGGPSPAHPRRRGSDRRSRSLGAGSRRARRGRGHAAVPGDDAAGRR